MARVPIIVGLVVSVIWCSAAVRGVRTVGIVAANITKPLKTIGDFCNALTAHSNRSGVVGATGNVVKAGAGMLLKGFGKLANAFQGGDCAPEVELSDGRTTFLKCYDFGSKDKAQDEGVCAIMRHKACVTSAQCRFGTVCVYRKMYEDKQGEDAPTNPLFSKEKGAKNGVPAGTIAEEEAEKTCEYDIPFEVSADPGMIDASGMSSSLDLEDEDEREKALIGTEPGHKCVGSELSASGWGEGSTCKCTLFQGVAIKENGEEADGTPQPILSDAPMVCTNETSGEIVWEGEGVCKVFQFGSCEDTSDCAAGMTCLGDECNYIDAKSGFKAATKEDQAKLEKLLSEKVVMVAEHLQRTEFEKGSQACYPGEDKYVTPYAQSSELKKYWMNRIQVAFGEGAIARDMKAEGTSGSGASFFASANYEFLAKAIRGFEYEQFLELLPEKDSVSGRPTLVKIVERENTTSQTILNVPILGFEWMLNEDKGVQPWVVVVNSTFSQLRDIGLNAWGEDESGAGGVAVKVNTYDIKPYTALSKHRPGWLERMFAEDIRIASDAWKGYDLIVKSWKQDESFMENYTLVDYSHFPAHYDNLAQPVEKPPINCAAEQKCKPGNCRMVCVTLIDWLMTFHNPGMAKMIENKLPIIKGKWDEYGPKFTTMLECTGDLGAAWRPEDEDGNPITPMKLCEQDGNAEGCVEKCKDGECPQGKGHTDGNEQYTMVGQWKVKAPSADTVLVNDLWFKMGKCQQWFLQTCKGKVRNRHVEVLAPLDYVKLAPLDYVKAKTENQKIFNAAYSNDARCAFEVIKGVDFKSVVNMCPAKLQEKCNLAWGEERNQRRAGFRWF